MTKPKKLPYKEFVKIYTKVPRFCVDIVIQTEEGILFTKRSIEPAKGKWHLPGGTVLLNENISETIKRVAKEEVGIKVKIINNIDYTEYFSPTVIGQAISLAVLCEPLSNKYVGGLQGKEISFFKKPTKNILKEQVNLLLKNKLMSK